MPSRLETPSRTNQDGHQVQLLQAPPAEGLEDNPNINPQEFEVKYVKTGEKLN